MPNINVNAIVKSQTSVVWVQNYWVALKFDRSFCSIAAEPPAKFRAIPQIQRSIAQLRDFIIYICRKYGKPFHATAGLTSWPSESGTTSCQCGNHNIFYTSVFV